MGYFESMDRTDAANSVSTSGALESEQRLAECGLLPKTLTIGEYFISEPEWNIFLYFAGAFHAPHSIKYPWAFVVKCLASLGIILATFGFCYDMYLNEHTFRSSVYCFADGVVALQAATIVVGIVYAVNRMREPLNKAIIDELHYVRDKSFTYTILAILMCIFTFVVIFINGTTAVTYYSFELSIATIVSSLLVTNMLSLWMVVFIWFDVKSCMIISQTVMKLAKSRRLTPASYVSAHSKFVRQIDRIASVLDIVVVVAYINTLTYFVILLIIPSYISVSYLATFGRETVILFMVLPDLATVNDIHSELVRIIVDKDRYNMNIGVPFADPGDSEGNNNHTHNNLNFNIAQSSDSVSFSTSGLGSAINSDSDSIPSYFLPVHAEEGNSYNLYMIVKEFPLQIPIIMKSKVFTMNHIRNQCFGVLLAALGLLVKVIVDNRYS